MAWKGVRKRAAGGVLLSGLFLVGTAAADAIGEAVRLVESRHPVLAAQGVERQALARQRNWSADLFVGWTQRGTEFSPEAGPNAGIRVTIPLFDRSHEMETARTRTAWARERHSVIDAFLAEIQALKSMALQVENADASRALYRDRLEYWRQAVDEGKTEAERLWPEAEALQKADQAYRSAVDGRETERERVARQYGGDEWMRLSALLAEIAP